MSVVWCVAGDPLPLREYIYYIIFYLYTYWGISTHCRLPPSHVLHNSIEDHTETKFKNQRMEPKLSEQQREMSLL